MPSPLTRPQARDLFLRAIGPSPRVVVTGATGWFGRTTLALLAGSDAAVLPIASRARAVQMPGGSVQVDTWSEAAVRHFGPTHVFDCAFLTKDRLGAGNNDLEAFTALNRLMTARMLQLAALPSVRSVVTISSGAAVHPIDALERPFREEPYGHLKREAEVGLDALAHSRGIGAVSARAWAASGAFVQRPRTFAMADMILQTRTGRIEITSTRPVMRRYTLVDDLVAVAAARAVDGGGIVESGGDLVEMADLADAVRRVVRPDVVVVRPPLAGDDPHPYVNDGVAWAREVARLGLEPANLEEQIRITWAGLNTFFADAPALDRLHEPLASEQPGASEQR